MYARARVCVCVCVCVCLCVFCTITDYSPRPNNICGISWKANDHEISNILTVFFKYIQNSKTIRVCSLKFWPLCNFNRALKISQSLKAKTKHLFVLLFTNLINLATFIYTQQYPQSFNFWDVTLCFWINSYRHFEVHPILTAWR